MGNLFAEAKLKTALANDTYTDKKEIVSKAGYLLGVDKNIFDSGELLPEIYEELEKNQDARMVRNLSAALRLPMRTQKARDMHLPSTRGCCRISSKSTALMPCSL